ncbi:transposase [Verrucomicrobia bacterium]|nr:transposase [Verrucomicrobiota bacterium]
MKCRVERKLQKGTKRPILRDDLVRLVNNKSRENYPELMRRIVARAEVDGRMQEIVFLTNNLIWSSSSVADPYRCRWSIEVFFKQLKQTLQLGDFLGHNANAVKLQVWIALLVFVLLRYLH